MTARRGRRLHAAGLSALMLSSSLIVHTGCQSDFRRSNLPRTLSDQQFWTVSTGLSEAPGLFAHSDNLVSNEPHFVHVARMLRTKGGVYIGVGPEQNYSYIARLRPEMAFIIDIRRENQGLHLMYKALFEVSTDRADFMSRLFSRERPPRLGAHTSVRDLFAAYAAAKPADGLREANITLVRDRLLSTHGFPLSPDDLQWIDYAFHAFYTDGPQIQYGRTRPGDAPGPSYAVLMTARDMRGQSRSYLATEEGFAFVKDLHAKNLIVPIVGDFAGPHAIRRTADYIRRHHGIVNAFYGSNVEVYLNRERTGVFCRSLATLPHDSRSWFIGSKGIQPFASKLKSCASGPR
jgi:hypothetical protein